MQGSGNQIIGRHQIHSIWYMKLTGNTMEESETAMGGACTWEDGAHEEHKYTFRLHFMQIITPTL